MSVKMGVLMVHNKRGGVLRKESEPQHTAA
jgi:hypothetical protein